MSSNKTTQQRFNEILSFKNDKERLQFEAEMIHLDIMHEVQCLMQSEMFNLNKTQLAEMLDVSKGYLTQLFTGDKLINLKTLAKLQRIFNIKFSVSCTHIEWLDLKTQEHKFKRTSYQQNSNSWKERIPHANKMYDYNEISEKGLQGSA